MAKGKFKLVSNNGAVWLEWMDENGKECGVECESLAYVVERLGDKKIKKALSGNGDKWMVHPTQEAQIKVDGKTVARVWTSKRIFTPRGDAMTEIELLNGAEIDVLNESERTGK